jgi:hypothetical protein
VKQKNPPSGDLGGQKMNRNENWKLSTDPTQPPQRKGGRTKKHDLEQISPPLGDLGGQKKD